MPVAAAAGVLAGVAVHSVQKVPFSNFNKFNSLLTFYKK